MHNINLRELFKKYEHKKRLFLITLTKTRLCLMKYIYIFFKLSKKGTIMTKIFLFSIKLFKFYLHPTVCWFLENKFIVDFRNNRARNIQYDLKYLRYETLKTTTKRSIIFVLM